MMAVHKQCLETSADKLCSRWIEQCCLINKRFPGESWSYSHCASLRCRSGAASQHKGARKCLLSSRRGHVVFPRTCSWEAVGVEMTEGGQEVKWWCKMIQLTKYAGRNFHREDCCINAIFPFPLCSMVNRAAFSMLKVPDLNPVRL